MYSLAGRKLDKKLTESVLTAFRDHYVAAERTVLLVSGGVDSMVLLYVMAQWAKEGQLAPFHVLHVNYHLRKDSTLDEELVTTTCQQLNVPCHIKSCDIRARAQHWQQSVNIQAYARKLRYHWGRELLAEKQLRYLITAYHADDRVETLLWKLSEKKSLAALVEPKSLLARQQIFRPLMQVWKSDILTWAQAKKIPYREDSTNNELAYKRNNFRQQLIPYLSKYLPAIKGALLTFQDRLLTAEVLMEKLWTATGIVGVRGALIYLGAAFWRRHVNDAAMPLTAKQPLHAGPPAAGNLGQTSLITLTYAEKLYLLQRALLKGYPQRRFSQGEIEAIFSKLDTGKRTKCLFKDKAQGEIYYSRHILAALPCDKPRHEKIACKRAASQRAFIAKNNFNNKGIILTKWDVLRFKRGSLLFKVFSAKDRAGGNEKTPIAATVKAKTSAGLEENSPMPPPVPPDTNIIVESLDGINGISRLVMAEICRGSNKDYQAKEVEDRVYLSFVPLSHEVFMWRSQRKTGKRILQDLKIPYHCWGDSWVVHLVIPLAASLAGAGGANFLAPAKIDAKFSHVGMNDTQTSNIFRWAYVEKSLKLTENALSWQLGVFSPYALHLRQCGFLHHPLKGILLFMDDYWYKWTQATAIQGKVDIAGGKGAGENDRLTGRQGGSLSEAYTLHSEGITWEGDYNKAWQGPPVTTNEAKAAKNPKENCDDHYDRSLWSVDNKEWVLCWETACQS